LTTQPRKPFEAVTLDLVKAGNHLILVIECQFTRYVETAVVESKNAETVYKQIEKTLFTATDHRRRSVRTTEPSSMVSPLPGSRWASNGVAALRTTRRATEWSSAQTSR
jgi:hypothetical protein